MYSYDYSWSRLGTSKSAVIRKEDGKFCVRSPSNPDWNGGCYDTEDEAKERLHQVEYFKGKKAAGPRLIADCEKAIKALEKGDQKPLLDFCRSTLDIISPKDVWPEWFYSLGRNKQSALKSLRHDMLYCLSEMEDPDLPDWRKEAWVKDAGKWKKDLRTVEIILDGLGEEKEVKHGPFTVIPMAGVPLSQAKSALDLLDAATAKLRSAFPKVLYGKVYLSPKLKGSAIALYIPADDTIHIDLKAAKNYGDMHTVLHEFGHRYDHKFLNKGVKSKFWDLSTKKSYDTRVFDEKLRGQIAEEVVQASKLRAQGKPIPPFSPDLVTWMKSKMGQPIRDAISLFLAGKISEEELEESAKGKSNVELEVGEGRGPLYVSTYGATKPSENFAEAFAFHLLGKDMPPELAAIMEDLAGG